MKYLLSLSVILLSLKGLGQNTLDNLFKVDYDTPLTIELDSKEEELIQPVAKKKKRTNPKIFYGIKTKKGFTRAGFGKDVVVELFHYLKEFESPDPYVQDFYWYDFKKKKIVNSFKIDEKNAGVLHGSYVKKIGDQVIEEGYFYKGLKHQRWVRYNRHDILQNKAIYWKGWPQESWLAFYDFDRTVLREMIPVHFKERNGTYYAFHQNGEIAATGLYQHDQRVGIWREYYPNKRVKRELYYSNRPFDSDFDPYISKEWNQEGQLIYDHQKFLKGE